MVRFLAFNLLLLGTIAALPAQETSRVRLPFPFSFASGSRAPGSVPLENREPPVEQFKHNGNPRREKPWFAGLVTDWSVADWLGRHDPTPCTWPSAVPLDDARLENPSGRVSHAMTKFLRPRPAAKLLAETDAGNVVLVQRLGSAGPGVSGRLRGEYGETDDKERRLGGSLFFNTPWNLAVDGQWDSRREHLPGPPSHRNAFWTGDANLVYRLAPTDTIGIRSGVGVNLLHDHGKTDAGFNLTYATEFFIRRPWLVSADVDWGSVGGETVFHWRATAGWLAGRLELYVGYDHYEVGDRKFAGPLAGAGLWF